MCFKQKSSSDFLVSEYIPTETTTTSIRKKKKHLGEPWRSLRLGNCNEESSATRGRKTHLQLPPSSAVSTYQVIKRPCNKGRSFVGSIRPPWMMQGLNQEWHESFIFLPVFLASKFDFGFQFGKIWFSAPRFYSKSFNVPGGRRMRFWWILSFSSSRWFTQQGDGPKPRSTWGLFVADRLGQQVTLHWKGRDVHV